MLERFKPVRLTKDIEMAEWIWNSHWWIEYYPGYYKCKWCEACHTSLMSVGQDFPLCPGNKAIKKLLAENKKQQG